MDFNFYGYTLREIIPITVLLITFIIQTVYYLGKYGKVASYKQKVSKDKPPVSVVVVLEDNLYFVENTLPLLLEQDYDDYEVVVVNYGSGQDVSEVLENYKLRYPHLKTTRINIDVKYKRRRKFALNVGIKATGYPNIIFTESHCHPVSPQWLAMMAKGFTTGEIVVGYTGIEPKKGLINKLIRCSKMMVSVRHLSSAIRGKTYKASSCNMGFTSQLYFSNKGYNYQKYNTGDDDLFIGRIANRKNTSVVLNPQATNREYLPGGLGHWWNERKYGSYTYRHYPAGAKAATFTELLTRVLFFASATLCLVWMIPYGWIAAAALLVLRWMIVYYTVFRISLRLGEKNILSVFFLYDIVSPFGETLLSLSRRIRPSEGIWS